MSRNEGEEEEELFVWMVFLFLKAFSLSSVTMVREGMSVGENRMIENTLQRDATNTVERHASFKRCEGCEFRQVYSSVHPCIATSHYQFTPITLLETA